ncbi:MAG: TetR/AcrR family transcriptional regulator [Verrucomicrobium sp.]|nr:TetR/AcrR family transcriptional regulator [Verrucomicrobium sp.]
MAARPSSHVDEKLLTAARELLPEIGCHKLSLRQVAAHAGVNLGMFHYHFGNKEAFLEALISRTYDEILAQLDHVGTANDSPLENLRAALNTLGRWVRDHRQLLMRFAGDAMAGEQVVVRGFVKNQPRILGTMAPRVMAAQKAGQLPQIALPQIIGMIAGTITMPLVVGTVMSKFQLVPAPMLEGLEESVFSDAAISQRINMALAGLQSALPNAAPANPV